MAYVDNNGVRIHYQVEGEGPPLVIQHGYTDSMETWKPGTSSAMSTR